MRPISLRPKFVERVWGATSLDPWYPPVDRRIGEVWLSSDDIETSEGTPLGELTSRPEIMGTAVPGEAFGTAKHIRISYATSMHEIERGLDRIHNFIVGLG